MAKYVIAGKADCPFFSKAELLGDELHLLLPDFQVHKIVVPPENWREWLKETCEERGWSHNTSPIIWRELIDRGGKGILVGGCDDFQEMADAYYGVSSQKMSEELSKIAKENLATKRAVDEEKAEAAKAINPLRITITGASSPVDYALLNTLVSGEIFGHEQDISLTLLDTPEKTQELEGVVMEIYDSAQDLLRNISHVSDAKNVFKDADLIIMLDSASPSACNSSCVEMARYFKEYAEVLAENGCKQDTKILVCGQHANLYATIFTKYAPTFPKKNIYALSRLEENRAKATIARKLNVNSFGVIDLVIWGSPGSDDYIDISRSQVKGYDGAIWAPHITTFSQSVIEMVHDDQWLANEFLPEVKEHDTKLDKYPSMSMAAAILDFIKEWWHSSCQQMTSLGMTSQGWYGVPENIVFSFPVKVIDGSWEVVSNLELSSDVIERIQAIGKHIQTEIEDIINAL